jgi:hypothetical protein
MADHPSRLGGQGDPGRDEATLGIWVISVRRSGHLSSQEVSGDGFVDFSGWEVGQHLFERFLFDDVAEGIVDSRAALVG